MRCFRAFRIHSIVKGCMEFTDADIWSVSKQAWWCIVSKRARWCIVLLRASIESEAAKWLCLAIIAMYKEIALWSPTIININCLLDEGLHVGWPGCRGMLDCLDAMVCWIAWMLWYVGLQELHLENCLATLSKGMFQGKEGVLMSVLHAIVNHICWLYHFCWHTWISKWSECFGPKNITR